MKKKGVTLIVSVLCMGCLFGAYAFLKSRNARSEAEETAAANRPILELDTENPASLTFSIGDTTVEFTYADETWTKADDKTFPVNADAIKTLLTDLAAVSAVRTLEDVEDISEYGFEEPQNTFIYTDAAGKTINMTIGATNEGTGDDYFLVEDGEQKLYTISSTLRSSVSDDIYDYALAETLPDIREEDIQAVEVEKTEGTYRIYKEGTTWYMETDEGEALPVDKDSVETEISALSYSLSYSDFLEHNCEDASVYGIDEDSVVFTIRYQTGEAEEAASEETVSGNGTQETETEGRSGEIKELTFRVGTTDDVGNYYVQKDGSKEVHTISADVLSAFLDGTAEDWVAETEIETEEDTEK